MKARMEKLGVLSSYSRPPSEQRQSVLWVTVSDLKISTGMAFLGFFQFIGCTRLGAEFQSRV